MFENLEEIISFIGSLPTVPYRLNGYDTAILGIDQSTGRVVYSYKAMVESHLDNMDSAEAMQYIEQHVIQNLPKYGNLAPIIIYPLITK